MELLPIDDALKRDFYAAMCKSEGWSVRTLRDRKNSMLYERTAISRKPEETIQDDIFQLMDQDKMSLDMFYRDPYAPFRIFLSARLSPEHSKAAH